MPPTDRSRCLAWSFHVAPRMKTASVAEHARSAGHAVLTARHRFAVGGVALALVAALGAPALARVVTRQAATLPIESSLIAIGLLFAVGFFVAGWLIGRRVDLLAEEARRDPVTRVGNRRHWEECLTHEVDAAAAARMPLTLLMVDVDNLKKLNDSAGHALGDRALALVGDVLTDTCRARDVAARFGGDEFAVLLPRTRASEALVVAERIRSELARRRASEAGPLDRLLTVSIGIADLSNVDAPHAHVLFDAADRALYAAKADGRDRVCIFEAEAGARSSVISLADHRQARLKRQTQGR